MYHYVLFFHDIIQHIGILDDCYWRASALAAKLFGEFTVEEWTDHSLHFLPKNAPKPTTDILYIELVDNKNTEGWQRFIEKQKRI